MRYCYLHGFASGPGSGKARYLSGALATAGLHLEIPALDDNDFEHLTITRQLAVIERHLHCDPVCLIGSSMGGYLAALYAASHPEVARIVLLAPALGFAPLFQRTLPHAELTHWRETGWREVPHHGTGTTRKVWYELLEDALRYPASPDFTQPALLFHGVHDETVPISLSRDFARNHRNVEMFELDSGHELLNVLDRIAELTVPFLERI